MIGCTEFIPAYSQLFKTLERLGGRNAVDAFWRHLASTFLHNLRDLVAANGIRGCWLYWSRTLSEEAADFTMELDEAAGEFVITMHKCPSKGRLLECRHIEPYPDYCRHCDRLYREVLEPLGYSYEIDLSECDRARCRLVVRRRAPANREATAAGELNAEGSR
jgi:hypothetical protein